MQAQTIDVTGWRAGLRVKLLAARAAVPLAQRRRQDVRMTDMLQFAFHALAKRTVAFYWPMKAEFDPRETVLRWRGMGARLALPVVVRKAAPMKFLEWWPEVETCPGAFGLPVPQATAELTPDAVLMPPVGFDALGYRLGYGGGYFDRTLATFAPQPIKVGLARDLSRVDTIMPQPHDIPMDFVVTETGVYEVSAGGLRLVERLGEAARLVETLLQRRRYIAAADLGAFLNTLLEAERAGAKVLARFADELPVAPSDREALLELQRDESRNCAVLLRLLRRNGTPASRKTSDFLKRALAVEGTAARLEFLNRGQAWVARRLAVALPRIADAEMRDELQEMHDSHVRNVAACEDVLRRLR